MIYNVSNYLHEQVSKPLFQKPSLLRERRNYVSHDYRKVILFPIQVSEPRQNIQIRSHSFLRTRSLGQAS